MKPGTLTKLMNGESCHRDVNMKKGYAKMVLGFSHQDKKNAARKFALDMVQQLDVDPNLFQKIISCDKT